MIPCKIFYNTRNGYSLQPKYFRSVAAALRDARQAEMAFSLFSTKNGELIKRGWYVGMPTIRRGI